MSGRKGPIAQLARLARAVGLAGFLVAGAPSGAQDLPTGGQSDCAEIVHREPNVLEVIQTAPDCVINWDTFSIGQGFIVDFQQESTWRALNRVNFDELSVIAGQLTAEGTIYLVNPAGITFTPTAMVNVGGIFAAAAAITDEDFLAGIDRFTDPAGEVSSAGSITAQAVHLIGRRVANAGTIQAGAGAVTMLAGENEILIGEAGGRILVRIDGVDLGGGGAGATPATGPGGPAVENSGTVDAAGGDVVLGAGDLFSLAVRNSGQIKTSGGSTRLAAVAGSVVHGGASASIATGELAMSGSEIVLESAIQADSARFEGAVVVGANVLIGGDAALEAQEVVFASTVDSEAGEANQLAVNAASTTFEGAVGGQTPLGQLDVTGSSSIEMAGDVTAVGRVALTAPLIEADADVESLAERVVFTGTTVVGGSVSAVGDARFDGDAQIAGDVLSAFNDALFFADAFVGGDVVVGDDAEFSGTAQVAGSVTAADDVRFFADAEVGGDVTATGDDVRFSATAIVDGTVSAADDARFEGQAEIGGDVFAGDDALFFADAVVDGGVTALDNAEFEGRTTVAGDVSAGDDAVFLATADLGGDVTAGDDARFADADVEGAITAADDVSFSGDALLAGDVSAGGTVLFERHVTLDGAGDQSLEAQSEILTARGTVLKTTPGSLTLAAPVVVLEGGRVEAAGDVNLNPEGRSDIPVIATVAGIGDLAIVSTGGRVFMGLHEKLTVLGTLVIEAASSATLGDVSTLGDMIVQAATVLLRARDPGFVLNFAGVLEADTGMDLVAGGRFYFSTTPGVIGSGPEPLLGSPNADADALGTLTGFPFRQLPFFDATLFTFDGTVLDLRANRGSASTSLAQSLGEIDPPPPSAPPVADAVRPDPDDLEVLRRLGIEVYGLGDAPRLRPAAVEVVADLYRALVEDVLVDDVTGEAVPLDRAARVESTLGRSWQAYLRAGGPDDGSRLGLYLGRNPEWSEAETYLGQLGQLLDALERTGLTPAEIEQALDRFLEPLTPDEMGPERLRNAIENR